MLRREFLRQLALSVPVAGVAGCGAQGGAAGAGSSPADVGPALPLRQSLNSDWRFVRDQEADSFAPELDDTGWAPATLPHTARVEAVVTGPPASDTYQWQGTAWYRRRFIVPRAAAGHRVVLRFEAAMNVADVWLDGEHLGQHLGGYLPFGFDITERVSAQGEHVLAVRLDNRDNAVTGPKPLSELDYNTYGGLYREVWLDLEAPLHITDPILEKKVASGGVFVTYPSVSSDEATLQIQVHVRNDDGVPRQFQLRCVLLGANGEQASLTTSDAVSLEAGADVQLTHVVTLAQPALWSPRAPNLYTLRTELIDGEAVVDSKATRIGVRRLELTAAGFRINGEPMFLRGTNRHQEYPYVGYALPAAAQYRDARKIKEAGFDFVRLSHYPHHSAFLDACDELGLVVMNCIPGWQYFNSDPAFAEVQYENCRGLLRRDRNHPSSILWEVSLNETEMPPDFIARTHAIAHEEYPGDQCYTSGWRDGYDVFVQARQHGGCRGITGRACLVSEYGDWEYYAQNAGLQQTGWADLAPDDKNSRQLRWHGERALLQQARNFQQASAGNRQTIAFADGLWVMFDYNRGYAPDLESSGCMDLFRLPKFSYHFFRSQRDASEASSASAGPMVFIASYWTATSPLDVRVFSNGESVELYRDGVLLERRTPDQDALSLGLAHPPFTFQLTSFTPGTLEAVAYLGSSEAARHQVRTPGPIRQLALWLDEGGRAFAESGKDVVIAHAELRDEQGTLVADAWENVFFGVDGDAALVGANPFSSDGGIASILLEAEVAPSPSALYAVSLLREGDLFRVLSGAVSAGAAVSAYELRITTDGSAPEPSSPLYDQPVTGVQIRVGLFIGARRIVDASSSAVPFRLLGSRAPT